jgi:hypothetical protein
MGELKDPADLIGRKTPHKAFWNTQKHPACANTNHLGEFAILPLSFFAVGAHWGSII